LFSLTGQLHPLAIASGEPGGIGFVFGRWEFDIDVCNEKDLILEIFVIFAVSDKVFMYLNHLFSCH